MSNIKEVIIKLENLSDEEQIKLWMNLWKFADKELSSEKILTVFIKINEEK